MRPRDAWDGVFAWRGSVRPLAVLRIALGPIVLLHLAPFLRDMAAGVYYADAFYVPWVAWFPEAPRELYFALLGGCVLTAVTLSLGLFTRLSAIYAFGFVTYNFYLSQTHFRHNRNFLIIILLAAVLLPVGRHLSIDAWRRRRRRRDRAAPAGEARLWPLWLLRVEIAAIYFASGFSKLRDPDWFSGVVTWDRVVRFRGVAAREGAPEWLLDIVCRREFHTLFAKVAVLTELFIAVGLWFPRTRLAAVWTMFWFHASIELSASVQIFSYLAIAATVVWVTPCLRDRVVEIRAGSRAGRRALACVRWLDWLARFRVRVIDDDPAAPAVAVVDRDGRRWVGVGGWWLLLSRLPLTFVPVAPLGLPVIRRLWRGRPAGIGG